MQLFEEYLHRQGTMSNEDLIILLFGSRNDQEKAIGFLIKEEQQNKTLWRILKRMSARWDDYQDVFMDALTKLLVSIAKENFRKDGNVRAYLNQIAKNLWVGQSGKNRKDRGGDHIDSFYESEVEVVIPGMEDVSEERWRAGMKIFSKLSARCRKLLILAFLKGYKNSEIAEMMGYDSEKVVRVKKSKCLKRLRELRDNLDE